MVRYWKKTVRRCLNCRRQSIKEVPAIHCFAAGKRQESRRLFLENLSGAEIYGKEGFSQKDLTT